MDNCLSSLECETPAKGIFQAIKIFASPSRLGSGTLNEEGGLVQAFLPNLVTLERLYPENQWSCRVPRKHGKAKHQLYRTPSVNLYTSVPTLCGM
jgi:hypothetical protein